MPARETILSPPARNPWSMIDGAESDWARVLVCFCQ